MSIFHKLTFFVLLCFFLCLCNGGPKERMDKKGNVVVKYTDEEDKFIANEVSKLIGEFKSAYSAEMWTKIAKTHSDKRTQKTTGFSQERSARALCNHFQAVFLGTNSRHKGKMPEDLLEKLILLQETKIGRGNERMRRRSYTTEEDNLIFDEMLNPSCVHALGHPTLKSITAKLVKKHQEKTPGFDVERALPGLRSHIYDMQRKGQFPEAVLNKFPVLAKGASSSGSSSSSHCEIQEIDFPVQNEEPAGNDFAEEMVDELLNQTDVVVDFARLQNGDNN